MKIYLYFKVDRGYYESAYASWRKTGGEFNAHLLRAQHTLHTWKNELTQLGHEVVVDVRSSYLLPQAQRARWPLPLARVMRGVLWASLVDPWLLQRDIVRQVVATKPDVVFVPLGSAIWESTLIALKQQGFKLAQWCGLPANTMLPRDRINLKHFDLLLVPANLSAGLRAAGARGAIIYTPIGIDPNIHRPVALTPAEQSRLGSDVCFIGGLGSRYHQTRRVMVEYAIQNGIQLKVWGGTRDQYLTSPILNVWQGAIWGEEQVKALCASKIGLNFHVDHQPGELDHGLNTRAFELPACRVFQLLQFVPSVTQFFDVNKEIVCFDNREEMLDKIRYYLAHPEERQRIAQAGYERVLKEHTWAARVRQMTQALQSL